MKTPHSTQYSFTAETIAHANRLPQDTVNERAHKTGMLMGEPLLIAMDALHKYAEAYSIRFEQPLAEDYILGPDWLASLKGLRGLLNGDGGHAMRHGSTTDSKDNGALEALFWDALKMAGYTEETAGL
jgi:hypothetical protein